MPPGHLHNGIPVPSPPSEVLNLASNYKELVYLVLFFDSKRTWLVNLFLSRTVQPLNVLSTDEPTIYSYSELCVEYE